MRQVSMGSKRDMSIRAALEWAFGTELARLDFEDVDTSVGTSTIYRLMQQGQLGCKIDGGGRSRAADDAEIIANAVAALPVALGGRSMAMSLADWARAGASPDWMPDAAPRCVPVAWRNTKHGYYARTELLRVETVIYRGRKVEHDVLVCPITFSPSAQQIGMARRRYLEWYASLLHLRYELASEQLRHIRLTDHLPVLSPWRTDIRAEEQAA
jgi:hypothetical protein